MPQSRIELLEDAIDNLIIDVDIVNQIVNGDVNTEVQTDSGPVSSLAKAIGDLENTARRLRDEAQQFRNEASDIKDQTDGLAFNAGVSENNAQNSADAASSSATDAQASATAASSSATDAQNSAQTSGVAADAAQNLLAEFQDIYHGRLSGGATPNSPKVGDLYFNEDADRMEVFTTAGWVPTASAQLFPEDFYEKVPNVEIKDPEHNHYGIEVNAQGGDNDSGIHINNRQGIGLSLHNSNTRTRGISIANANIGTAISIANYGGGDAIKIDRNDGNIIKSENFTVDKYGAIHQPFLYWGNGKGTTVLRGNFSDFFIENRNRITVINHNIRIIFTNSPSVNYHQDRYAAFRLLVNDEALLLYNFFIDLYIGDVFRSSYSAAESFNLDRLAIKIISILD